MGNEVSCPRCGGSGKIEAGSISVGDLIQSRREDRGLSRTELAELVDCSPPALIQIEKGVKDPSLGMLRRIAAALGCSIKDLVF